MTPRELVEKLRQKSKEFEWATKCEDLDGNGLNALAYDTEARALDEVATELEAALAGNGWKPIETAPRDGTPILLFTSDHGVVEAWFKPGEWSDETPDHPREYDGALWICADDTFQIEVEETPVGYMDGTATDWQPLPEPPEPAK